jgi:hypothetical protein
MRMSRFLNSLGAAALLASVYAGEVRAQSATSPVTLVPVGGQLAGQWTDLGAGPVEVQMLAGSASFAFGTTSSCAAVTGLGAPGFSLRYSNANANPGIPLYTTLHVCAEAVAGPNAEVLVFPIGAH